MSQTTLDGSPPPKVIHEGLLFSSSEWVKFRAIDIEKETDKAFQFRLLVHTGDPIDDIRHFKWVPKSIARVEEVKVGLVVKVPKWFMEKKE